MDNKNGREFTLPFFYFLCSLSVKGGTVSQETLLFGHRFSTVPNGKHSPVKVVYAVGVGLGVGVTPFTASTSPVRASVSAEQISPFLGMKVINQ